MHGRPFDAREAWLRETALPCSQWRTVSLVTAVRALVGGDGPARGGQRREILAAALDELTRRGIDGETLLRFGFAPELIAPLVLRAIVGRALGPTEQQQLDQVLRDRGADPGAWDAVLGPPTASASFSAVADVMASAVAWALVAPIDDVLSLTPPDPAGLKAATDQFQPDLELLHQYRWLIDRFSTTHLENWELSSLHYEYRYLAGEIPAPGPDELMSDRQVPANELNAEIALRAVYPRAAPEAIHGIALAQQMERQALEFLRAGRRREAAALFEFAIGQDPRNKLAHNDLGFCVLPEDQEKALQHIRRARELGYEPLAINVYNEVFALYVQGHNRRALQIADSQWKAIDGEAAVDSVLWTLANDGSIVLGEVADARQALAKLCLQMAKAQDAETYRRWNERGAS